MRRDTRSTVTVYVQASLRDESLPLVQWWLNHPLRAQRDLIVCDPSPAAPRAEVSLPNTGF